DDWRGEFEIATDVPPEHVVSTLNDIREEMARMRAEGPSASELNDAKANIAGVYPMGLETASQVAGAIVLAELHGLGLDYLESYPLRIAQVSAVQARAAARKLLDPDNLVLVVVGRGDKVAPALEQAGIKAERIPYTDPISAGARKRARAAKAALLS